MKRIILSLSLFISLTGFSQVDSSKLNVTTTMQFRDWAFLIGENAIDLTSVTGENLYDKIKTSVRSNAGITATVAIASDTMDAQAALNLSIALRDKRFMPASYHWTRINTALRGSTGVGAAWLVRRLDLLDDLDQADDTRRMLRGINRLKGIQQNETPF